MLKFRYLLLLTVLSVILFGCGSGAPRNPIDPNSYGVVSGSNVVGPVFSIESLQQYALSSGVCNGLRIQESGEIGGLAKLLCDSNNLSLSLNPQLSKLLSNGVKLNNFVSSNSLGITSVATYRIIYTTSGTPYQNAGNANDGVHNVSAAVLIPEINGTPLPESSIKGVFLYFHPTIASKGGVPSDFFGNIADQSSPPVLGDAATAINEDMLLASAYASQGFVVVVPDYVGQGIDWQYQHPYVLYPSTNAQSGFSAIKAVRSALSSSGLVLPTNTNLYIGGYSEGGAYALWASKMAQTQPYANFLAQNGYKLMRTVGMSGVYDLAGAMLNFEFQNANNSWESSVNTWNVSPGIQSVGLLADLYPTVRAISSLNVAQAKPPLAGYILSSFVYYNSSPAAGNVLAPKFSAMKNCLNLLNYFVESTSIPSTLVGGCPLSYDLSGLYNVRGISQVQVGSQALFSALGSSNYLTGGLPSGELLKAAAGGFSDNSLSDFIAPGVINDPTLIDFARKQTINSWVTNNPIDIIYLDYDSTVTNVNSQEACGTRFDYIPPGQSVKDLSPPGMVSCINVQNGSNTENPLSSLYTQDSTTGAPIFIDHGSAQFTLQLFALNQILANQP